MGLCPGIPLRYRSSMMLVVLAAVLAAASADCDACVDGHCYTRKTLARELVIPDQMAIDRKNGILYVHTDSNMNTAFLHEDLTIQLVRRQNFSGLAVDQDTQVLYTTDSLKMYKYKRDDLNTTTKLVTDDYASIKPHLLFYKNCLFFTDKSSPGLRLFKNNEYHYYAALINYTISDFVLQFGCDAIIVYFVANETVYCFRSDSTKVVAKKTHVLSTDKNDNVYFGDATVNVIYKMDEETNTLVEYAAYESGSVDKFVFDNNNNIVFYDSTDGSFSVWKPDFQDSGCTIEAPHSRYRIKKSILDLNGFIR